MRTRSLLLLLPLSLATLGCEKVASVDTAAEEQAIRGLSAGWNDLIVAKNDSSIAALYAPGAVMLPPNQDQVTGTAAIRDFWAFLWPMNATLVTTPTAVKVAAAGDLASESGTWVFSASSPTGPLTDRGKYLIVWTKADGAWKVSSHTWNTSNPPPGMPPAAGDTATATM